MNKRFKELRKELDKTQLEFAESIGMSQNFIAQIEMGKKVPSDRTIKDICQKYSVNYDWLVYGEGEMFTDEGDAQAIVDAFMAESSDFAKKMVIMLMSLGEERWKEIEDAVKKLSQ